MPTKTLEEQIAETMRTASGFLAPGPKPWRKAVNVKLDHDVHQVAKRLGNISDFLHAACRHYMQSPEFEDYVREQLDPRQRQARIEREKKERQRYTNTLRKLDLSPEERAIEAERVAERERILEERRERVRQRKETKANLERGEKLLAKREREREKKEAHKKEVMRKRRREAIARRKKDREEQAARQAAARAKNPNKRDADYWKKHSEELQRKHREEYGEPDTPSIKYPPPPDS